jgi:hypothetical protein
MTIQELEQAYQQLKDELNERQMIKLKTQKQQLKDALIKDLLEPDGKEIDINSKILFDGLNEFMLTNGITFTNTKMAFIDLYVELFADLCKNKVTGESINGSDMIDSFCNQYQLTIDRNMLYIIVNAISILFYGYS